MPPIPGPDPGQGQGSGQDGGLTPRFARLEDWMDEYFLKMFHRPPGCCWCPEWWRHEEAVTRLTACWLSWEALRLEPATGISEWLRDHLDYHLGVLTGQLGPFYQCRSETGHIPTKPFASKPVDFSELGDEP